MAISKVVFGTDTLIDLTADTVEASKLLAGYTAHDAMGEAVTGTCTYDANTASADANASELLSGAKAVVKGVMLTGTMPNRGTVAKTLSSAANGVSLDDGYYEGGTVSIDAASKAALVANNIREGVQILGVTGTMSGSEGQSFQTKTITPSTSADINVTPDSASGYTALSAVTVKKIPYSSTTVNGKTTVTIG